MKYNELSMSKNCSGTCFNPNKNEYSISISIITNELYIDLKFKESKIPELSINANSGAGYTDVELHQFITFKQFKELFFILTGNVFDSNIDSWDSLESY